MSNFEKLFQNDSSRGVAIGAGGALMSDFLFFQSLKDKKFSEDEVESLTTMSRAISSATTSPNAHGRSNISGNG